MTLGVCSRSALASGQNLQDMKAGNTGTSDGSPDKKPGKHQHAQHLYLKFILRVLQLICLLL
jgi:hypothetical protein